MQEADDLDVALGRGSVDDEMTGRTTPPRDVEGANSRANLVALTAEWVLRMLKQLGECVFDQRAVFRALRWAPTTLALLQGVGDVRACSRGEKEPHQLVVGSDAISSASISSR
jgi:hypothetical protein